MSSLLTSGEHDQDSVKRILEIPALVEEARQVQVVIERFAKDPAGEEGVKRVVGSRFMLFPQPERTREQEGFWWADYVDALHEQPEHTLEAGMKAWIKSGAQFMPKPGQLLELALISPSPVVRAVARLRKVLERRPAAEIPWTQKPRELPSEADKAEVRRMAADFTARTMPKETDRPKERAHYGRPPEVDEAGITPQMREAMARRYGAQEQAPE